MILCDSNILIELYRNNPNIVSVIKAVGQDNVSISDVTRAELYVGARNKHEFNILRKDMNILIILPIQPSISSMSISLLEEYHLSHGLDYHDALIAATSICYHIELFTLNLKDFVFIPGIHLYRP